MIAGYARGGYDDVRGGGGGPPRGYDDRDRYCLGLGVCNVVLGVAQVSDS